MPNNKLILRSVNSPWVTPFNDITTGSVLSWADVDNNFIYLKGEIIHTGYTSGNTLILEKINGKTIDLDLERFGDEGNRWYVPSDKVVEVPSDYQSFIYGDLYLEGLIKLNDNSQLVVLNGDIIMNGGSISGNGTTLLVDLPMFDTKLVNGYFDSGILSLVDNAGNIITVSGISATDIFVTGFTYQDNTFTISDTSGNTLSATIDVMSGLTINGNLIANNISGTTNYIPKFTPNSYSIGNSIITNNSNNVSIGTISTPYRFYVLGNNTTSGQPLFVVRDTGRIGIRTASPLAELSIENSNPSISQDIMTLRNNGAGIGTGNSIRFINSTNSSSTVGSKIESTITNLSGRNKLGFYVHGGGGGFGALLERMSIDGTGNVLISNSLRVPTISATTYQNLPPTTTYSAGVISGSTGWSATGSGQINLPDLKVALFDNTNNIGSIVVYDVQAGVSGSGGIDPLVNNDTNYVVINYNNGNPIYEVLNNPGTVNHSDIILYLIVYRLDNFIHVLEFGNDGAGLPNKLNNRLLSTERFAREDGLSLGLSASTGVVLISSGIAWNGTNQQSLVGVNSQDDIFFQNYHSGGTWVYTTTADTINNSFYDDGTDIVSGTTGNYLVNWYYRGQEVNDHIYEVWSNDEYISVLDAEASSEPVLPELITSHAFLVGRIIIGVGETTGITQTAFGTVFQPSGYASGFHNDLLNIQGGAPGEYYHLSSNEYNNLSLSTTGATLDDDTIYFDTFGSLSAYTITLPNLGFTGNTSASCINDLWVTNIHGCSPVNIQDDLIVNGSVSADKYNGNIILNESTLTTFNGSILKTGTGTTVQGDVYYLNNSNGWSLTNANSIVSSDGLLGIAVGTDPSVDGMLINGLAKNISYTGTTGSPIYLSTVNGKLTEFPPSGVGYIIRIVGYKLGSSGSILFNPDPTWIELD
jgi:hypothetical protein